MHARTDHPPVGRTPTPRRADVATWICVVVGVVTLVNVSASSSFDTSGRGPFLVYSAVWLWAAWRLYRWGRGGLARGVSVVSLVVAAVAVVATMLLLVPWSDLGSVHVSWSGGVQLVVPVLGAIVVLLSLRTHQTQRTQSTLPAH